jgi:hypothetical protein
MDGDSARTLWSTSSFFKTDGHNHGGRIKRNHVHQQCIHTLSHTQSTRSTTQTRHSTHPQSWTSAKPKKCIFGSTTIEYLGHTISSDGVRPGKDKTQTMKDITEPKKMKQLKSFIGLANYFRSYFKGFACVESDLNELTR